MRTVIWLAVVAIFAFPGIGRCQQQGQSSSQTSAPAAAPAPAPQQDSLAEAARKAREQRKESAKAAKVFTNDNLPTEGISTVGSSSTATPSEATAAGGAKAPAGGDEKTWRDKFSALRHKLEQDQAELDVLQREVGVAEVQYYNGDPQKAQQDSSTMQPLGAEYNKKVADIDAKKKQVDADQQAISDAEDALHKSGGDPGWAR
ncbi:MAG: hypothetical protein ABR953_07905 [Candidatus Acidiferrales bacterium]|jgi:chromosome segregation ATPase